jgi:Tfp pilus assembly protein PilF
MIGGMRNRLLGVVRRAQFEVEEARGWLRKAVEADPADPEAWFNLAIVENEVADNDAAEAAARRAVELAPRKASYHYVYGEILRINKKGEEAIAAYRKAMDASPPHPKAGAKLALVMYESGDYAEAKAFLVEQIERDPENPYQYYNLGWVHSALKEYGPGIAAFERYLELAPKEDGDRKRAMDEIKSLRKKLQRLTAP